MNSANLDVSGFASVLERNLEDSKRRVRSESTFDKPVYWPGGNPDSIAFAGYSVESGMPAIREEVEEELTIIRATLDHLQFDYQLADSLTDHEATRIFATQLARHDLSMQIWTSVCVPIRRQGEFLFRVWMMSGVSGGPYMNGLHVDTFVRAVSDSVVEGVTEHADYRKSVRKLEIACSVLGIACIGMFLALV